MTERRHVMIDGQAYLLPLKGRRCPRCHRAAPRLDGIPCKLCSPTCGTLTDPNTGITHAYKGGCQAEIDLVSLKLKYFNVGPAVVDCFECIATLTDNPKPRFDTSGMVEYAQDDASSVLLMAYKLNTAGVR